jgi:hypothetical protein
MIRPRPTRHVNDQAEGRPPRRSSKRPSIPVLEIRAFVIVAIHLLDGQL